MAHHRKLPAAAGGEALLHFWRIGARNDHRRAVQQMVIDAVQSVGPQRAVGAGGAHIVDEDQVGLTGEQLGQPHRSLQSRQLVVGHLLGLDACLRRAHLLANGRDLAAEFGELRRRALVVHSLASVMSDDQVP